MMLYSISKQRESQDVASEEWRDLDKQRGRGTKHKMDYRPSLRSSDAASTAPSTNIRNHHKKAKKMDAVKNI